LAGIVSAETADEPDAAATRIWAAMECLQKAGRPASDPLVLGQTHPDGWVVFASGELRIATLLTMVRGNEKPVVFAVLAARGR
jgi:enediyne polyketide synthase